MRLPNVDLAIVEDRKITQYLLSEGHEDGHGKAEFFKAFGFCLQAPEVLIQALKDLALNADVSNVQASPHGTKYVVEGQIQAPDGSAPVIKTIWIIESGETRPRLVTAFPGKRTGR
jgi:hypothetical protein